jgi:sialic acid synthase SpsE
MDNGVQAVMAGDRRIGPGSPCFVIAEVGVNHNGRLELALKSIDVAKAAAADAVKFQTFRAERLVTRTAPTAQLPDGKSWRGEVSVRDAEGTGTVGRGP